MSDYLLDTNVASHVIKGDRPRIRERLLQVPMASVALSAITEAELRYGVANRGHAAGLASRVHEFLIRIDVLPWTSAVAQAYAELRATGEAAGAALAPMDMLIAAHALAEDRILVSRDGAFSNFIRLSPGLRVEDWSR